MLKKVLKYDLKFIYKVLAVFYFLVILSAVLTRILGLVQNSVVFSVLSSIMSGVTISLIFSVLINNMMRLWARFINNVYKDESYLTHTLPIEKRTIYLSKFASSVITTFTSVLVILLAIIIAYYSKENLVLLKNSLNVIASMYKSSIVELVGIVFFVFFLEMTVLIQSGYTGIIIGYRSNEHKMLKTIIYGIAIYIITNIIALLTLFVGGLFNKDILNLFFTNDLLNIDVVKEIMYLAIVFYVLIAGVYYIIDVRIFRKGVNVD